MRKQSFSRPIADAIRDHLTYLGRYFDKNEETGVFIFHQSLPDSSIRVLRFVIDVYDDAFLLYACPDFSVDPEDCELMSRMTECVNRVNLELWEGSFALDDRDGTLRFRLCVRCPGGRAPTPKAVQDSIQCALAAYARFSLAFTSVVFTGESPRKIVPMCPGREEPSTAVSELIAECGVLVSLEAVRKYLAELQKPGDDDDSDSAIPF